MILTGAALVLYKIASTFRRLEVAASALAAVAIMTATLLIVTWR